MAAQKLPFDQFLASFKFAPRIAVDLWVRNSQGAVLYTQRDTEPFKGHWHIPGSFLLLGESVEECVKRIAQEEVNLVLQGKDFKLVSLDEELQEPRGHVVHLVYQVREGDEVSETETRKFFFEPPKDLIPGHRKIFLSI